MAKKQSQSINEIKQSNSKLQDVSEIKRTRKLVQETCGRCGGEGTIPNAMYTDKKAPCPACGDSGQVRVMKDVSD